MKKIIKAVMYGRYCGFPDGIVQVASSSGAAKRRLLAASESWLLLLVAASSITTTVIILLCFLQHFTMTAILLDQYPPKCYLWCDTSIYGKK